MRPVDQLINWRGKDIGNPFRFPLYTYSHWMNFDLSVCVVSQKTKIVDLELVQCLKSGKENDLWNPTCFLW